MWEGVFNLSEIICRENLSAELSFQSRAIERSGFKRQHMTAKNLTTLLLGMTAHITGWVVRAGRKLEAMMVCS